MHRVRLLFIGVIFLLPGGAAGLGQAWLAPAGMLPVAAPVVRQQAPASGLFLVSSRKLTDPHFSRTVIYLVAHNDEGSLGLVVNRPSDIRLADAVSGVDKTPGDDYSIYYGGPVKHSMITMLIRSETENPLVQQVDDDVFFSHDRRVLDRLLDERKPVDALRLYMGHAGWVAGQLQQEIERGDWFVVAADPVTIFSTRPASIWTRLIEKLDPAGLYVGVGRPGYT
ncbi:MAG TPA: YqgE/AlgH family protein [Gammaproteobacteria bacterium]|nr:YqgE/AlgH family protein [Gammaproteobacteria bacterium]